MSNIAIKAENVSKYYRLGVINNGTLWRDIQTWWDLKRGKQDRHSQIGSHKYDGTAEGFWALKDLNFEIQQGERIGIIGHNGAGKSTLLKILSRITAPTEGSIKIKGRVASLLEVGTGFHGELTGRENIYLNGAILGMKRKEVDRKIDEIIAFSEIEQHIDTPVKRYSSGMYVRLAFAVAAHLDSEILIADEVLAVGDAAFQKKALGKMNELSSGQGRTVLFVSHNMAQIKKLCTKGLILDKGRLIRMDNNINDSIDYYLGLDNSSDEKFIEWNNNNYANDEFLPLSLEVLDEDGNKISGAVNYNQGFQIKLKSKIKVNDSRMGCYFNVYLGLEKLLVTPYNLFNSGIGDYEYTLKIPPKMFLPGNSYRFSLVVTIKGIRYIINPDSDSVFVTVNIETNQSVLS